MCTFQGLLAVITHHTCNLLCLWALEKVVFYIQAQRTVVQLKKKEQHHAIDNIILVHIIIHILCSAVCTNTVCLYAPGVVYLGVVYLAPLACTVHTLWIE